MDSWIHGFTKNFCQKHYPFTNQEIRKHSPKMKSSEYQHTLLLYCLWIYSCGFHLHSSIVEVATSSAWHCIVVKIVHDWILYYCTTQSCTFHAKFSLGTIRNYKKNPTFQSKVSAWQWIMSQGTMRPKYSKANVKWNNTSPTESEPNNLKQTYSYKAKIVFYWDFNKTKQTTSNGLNVLSSL